MDLGLTGTTVKTARARWASTFFPQDTATPKFYTRINEIVERFHDPDAAGGWVGKHAVFTVNTTDDTSFYLPFYLETVLAARCDTTPARMQGMRFEFLHDGPGELTADSVMPNNIIDLGVSGISTTFPSTASTLTFAAAAAADYGKTIRVVGYDASGNRINDATGAPGEDVVLGAGAVATTGVYLGVQGFQKELTVGRVTVKHVGADKTLAVLEPFMDNPTFRGYRVLDSSVDQVTLYCKRRPVPVNYEEDYIFPGHLGAIKLGLHALAFEDAGDIEKSDQYFVRAAALLNGEASTYRGANEEHLSFAPWGVGVSGIYRPR